VRDATTPTTSSSSMGSGPSGKRSSARQRGYDRRWEKARAAFLREPENRFCRKCQQRGPMTLATIVDHVVPHRGDPDLFWDRSNWQPLCKAHHDRDKQRQERGRFVVIDEDGWPVMHRRS
jgi:5-methylcytosine-specific restriction enzyme A